MRTTRNTTLSVATGLGLGFALSLASAPAALAGPPVGHDFNDGDFDGWSGPFPYTFSGEPPSGLNTEVVDGELAVAGVADAASGAIMVLDDSVGNPSYANGRASFEAHLDPDTDVALTVRSDLDTLTGYALGVAESPDDQSGTIFISVAVNNNVVDQEDIDVDFDVSDVRVDIAWIGDVFSITVSQLNGPESATLTLTDSTVTEFRSVSFLTEGGLSPASPPAPFSASYDNLTVAPLSWDRLDDFTGGLAEWLPVDLSSGLDPQFDTADGRATVSSSAAAGNLDGGLLVLTDSLAQPEAYTNGRVRTTFNVNDTNINIFARGDLDALTSYGLGFRPTDGRFSIVRNDGLMSSEALDVVFTSFGNDQDLNMELTFIGDEFTGKIWPVGEPEPAEPQLSATDSTYPQGGIALGADGPAVIGEPAPLDAEFGDVWFEPAESGVLGDLNGDGEVNGADLGLLLGQWTG